MKRHVLLLLASAVFLVGPVAAQHSSQPLRYALLSAVGDQMTVVYARTQTGSRIDRNDHQDVPLAQHALDRLVLKHLDAALRQAAPTAEVAALTAANASLLKAQQQVLGGRAPADSTVRTFANALPPGGADRLLLVLKHRAEARIPVRDGTIGLGKLEGVGFYVDRVTVLTSNATGNEAAGFLAPFAYMRLVLADASGRVLAEREIEAAQSFMMGDAPDALQPWDMMDASAKIAAVDRLIERQIQREVPQLLARAGQPPQAAR